nr:Mobile element protein [Salmonella enterica subsp. enterica serovar Rissen]
MKSVVMLKTISKKPNTTWRWVISAKVIWANEAVFQMMMLSYNLFLLFKFDSLDSSEYRQQIKTFRLKYVFLQQNNQNRKICNHEVVGKLSVQGVYEKCLV